MPEPLPLYDGEKQDEPSIMHGLRRKTKAFTDLPGNGFANGYCPHEEVNGWVMETDETISMTATEVVPLGHKLALKDIIVGETIFKYGQDIGKAVGDIRQGGHVHVQNVKTKRW